MGKEFYSPTRIACIVLLSYQVSISVCAANQSPLVIFALSEGITGEAFST